MPEIPKFANKPQSNPPPDGVQNQRKFPSPPVVQPEEPRVNRHNDNDGGGGFPWFLIFLLLAGGSAAAYYFFYYKKDAATATLPTASETRESAGEHSSPPSSAATPKPETVEENTRSDAANSSGSVKSHVIMDSVFVGPLWEGASSFFFVRDGTAWEWNNTLRSFSFGKWRKIDEETIHCSIGGGSIFKISPDKNQIQRHTENGSKVQAPCLRRTPSPSPDIREVRWDFEPGWELVFKADGTVVQQQVKEGESYSFNGKWTDLGGGYLGKRTPDDRDNNIYKVSKDNKTVEHRIPGGSRIWRRNGPVPSVIKFMPSLAPETHALAGTKWAYGAAGTVVIEFFPNGTMSYPMNNNGASLVRWFVLDGGTIKTEQGSSVFSISADGRLLSQIKENKVTEWRRIDSPQSSPSTTFETQSAPHPLAGTKWKSAVNENALLYFRADGALLFGQNFQKSAGRWKIVNHGTARDERKTVFYLALNKNLLTEITGNKAFLWHRQPDENVPEPSRFSAATAERGVREESEAPQPAEMDSASDILQAYNQDLRQLLTPVCDKYIVRLNKLKTTASGDMSGRIYEAIESIQQQKTYPWKPILESNNWTPTEHAFSKIKDEYDAERVKTYRILENKYKPIFTRAARTPGVISNNEEARALQQATVDLFPAKIYVQMHTWIPSWDRWQTWVFQEDGSVVIYDTSKGAKRTRKGAPLRWKIVNKGDSLYLVYSGDIFIPHDSKPFYFDLRTNNRDTVKSDVKSKRGETMSFRSVVHSRSR